MRAARIIAVVAVVAWLALYLSSNGLLIRSERIPWKSIGDPNWRCWYFVGTGIHAVQLYDYNALCPRLYSFAQ